MPTAEAVILEVGRQLDAVGPDGFVTGTATGGSSQAVLEDTVLLKSGMAQDDLYLDCWVWRPRAVDPNDVERVVKVYNPIGGTLQSDNGYIVAPTNGEVYAIFRMMSPSQILACLNRALRRMYFEWEVTVTPASDNLDRRYDLTSQYAWLQEQWQIRRAGYLANTQSRLAYDPYAAPVKGHAYRQNATLYAWLPAGYAPNNTFYLNTVRQHASMINGADSTVGVTAFSDTIDATLDWAVAGTLTECYKLLLRTGDKDTKDALLPEATANGQNFTRYSRQHFRMPRNEFGHSEYLPGSTSQQTDDSGLAARAG